MAALRQPRAVGQGNISVPEDALGEENTTWMSRNTATKALQWVGSITAGVVVGAAAAFLVAGVIGMNVSSASTVHVVDTSQVKPAP
jgi:hypothetical protein